jgi:hypothetical protein
MRDGILGLILYLTHWLSPGDDRVRIDTEFSGRTEPDKIVFICKMDPGWNDQLEKLIDAGIPLRFRISYYTDKSDTVAFYRSLQFNMIDFSYIYIDSTDTKNVRSHPYPMVLLALRDFCSWKIVIPYDATSCKVEAVILPSRAEQLNRFVDMSRIWGRQEVFSVFNPSEKMKKGSKRRS